ncbi:terminase [Spirosoma arcticum]
MSAPHGNSFAAGNEGGRPPKYKEEYADTAHKLCLLGHTDKDLAEFFEVDERTIYNWKVEHEEFFQAVKNGKTVADAEIAAAYFKRAKGYEYTETTFEKVDSKLTLEMTPDELIVQDAYKKKIVVKQLPPEPGAALNWLKNRQPQLWREGYDINLNKGEDVEVWSADDVTAFQKWKLSQQPVSTDGD